MSSIRNPLALPRALILHLPFIISSMIQVSEAILILPETLIQINNTLGSKSILQIHCKDRHHDLGIHKIRYSQTYEFKIPVSAFFGKTLYFCGFVWNHKLHWFDIFVKSRDQWLCKTKCRWIVKDVGPCLIGTFLGERCFEWNKNVAALGFDG